MTRRAGYTLIEMIVAITMSGAILAVAAGVLHGLLTSDKNGQQHMVRHQSLARLATDFRNDAHAALEADFSKASQLEFTLPERDRKIRYREAPDGLVREEQSGGAVRHREAYRLSEAVKIEFLKESSSPALLSLRIHTGTRPGEPLAGPPIRIDAAMGSDHRFAKLGGPGK
jgi:prepilin-type N-terminal cleavage/methylation domain-containing protein